MEAYLLIIALVAVVVSFLYFKKKGPVETVNRRVFFLGTNLAGKSRMFYRLTHPNLTSDQLANTVSSQKVNKKVVDGI
jgi:hypothetical protein